MAGDVIDKAVAVANIAARKVRLILDHGASLGQEAKFGSLHAVYCYLEDRAERRALLDEEGDVFAVEADYAGLFAGNFETEVFHIEGRGAFRIRRLDQDVATESVGHAGFLAAAKVAADE
jgi:hypothetical protein